MFDFVVDLVVSSDWAYAVVFAVAALDAVFPLVPSEATVVTAGALAASGRLSLTGVFLAAACGAFAGDNVGYAAGRLSAPAVRHLTDSQRAKHRLHWAGRGLANRAATVIVVSRFVPGGRTATMVTAGVTRFRWSRFARLDAVAAVLWAGYAVAIGVVGGMAFQDKPLYAVGLALGLAVGLAILFEGGRRGPVRWMRRNWRSPPRNLRM
jgi:membrane-associated protein